MKTQAELKAHYRDEIIPMVAKYNFDHSTDVKPWECVKWVHGEIEVTFVKHPDFSGSPESYIFALTILEAIPVFVGAKLYYKASSETHYTVMKNGLSPSTVIGVIPFDKQTWDDMSWTPPVKKRTFMLNGYTVAAPTEKIVGRNNELTIQSRNHTAYFRFLDEDDLNIAARMLINILTEARDKE